jgi:predicted methyltransferase
MDNEYQKCPICEGRGFVSGVFYTSVTDEGYSADAATQCRTCLGKGIILKPVIHPQQPNEDMAVRLSKFRSKEILDNWDDFPIGYQEVSIKHSKSILSFLSSHGFCQLSLEEIKMLELARKVKQGQKLAIIKCPNYKNISCEYPNCIDCEDFGIDVVEAIEVKHD